MPKKNSLPLHYYFEEKKNTGSDNYVYASANKAFSCTRLKMQFRKIISIPNDRPLPGVYITIFVLVYLILSLYCPNCFPLSLPVYMHVF